MGPDAVHVGVGKADAQRETLGAQRDAWALGYDPPGGGDRLRLTSTAPSLISDVTINAEDHTALVRRQHNATEEQPFAGEVLTELRLDGPRLSMTLAVENAGREVALREAQFPLLRLRRLTNGTDQLLVPHMSGVLHPDPVGNLVRYEGPYPSGAAQIYKRFARTADRWPESHSREDTPQWLRELTANLGADGAGNTRNGRSYLHCTSRVPVMSTTADISAVSAVPVLAVLSCSAGRPENALGDPAFEQTDARCLPQAWRPVFLGTAGEAVSANVFPRPLT